MDSGIAIGVCGETPEPLIQPPLPRAGQGPFPPPAVLI